MYIYVQQYVLRPLYWTLILPSKQYCVSTEGPEEGVYVWQPSTRPVKKATPTHLGDAQPDVLVPLRVAEAEPQLLGFVRVDVEPLEIACRAAGVNRIDFLSVAEYVQAPGSLGTPVEGDRDLFNVLRFLEGVPDAAPVVFIRAVEDFPLARPARVRPRFVVASVVGYAAAGAAAIAGRALVVPIGVNVDPRPHAGIDEGCGGSGVRPVRWWVGAIQYVPNVSFSLLVF